VAAVVGAAGAVAPAAAAPAADMAAPRKGVNGPQEGPVHRARGSLVDRARAGWRKAKTSLRPQPDGDAIVGDAPNLTLGAIARRYWPWLRPLRVPMLIGLALLVVAPVIEVVEIGLFQRVVDYVLVPADLGPLGLLALAYIGLNLASAVVSGVDDYLSTWISQRFAVSLRTDVFRHVLAQPQHVHDERRLGDVLQRLTADVSSVSRFMIDHLSNAASSVVRIAVYVGALFWLSWELTLASLVVVPFFWLISTRFARYVRAVSRERARRGGSMGAIAEEHLANTPLVQAYNRRDDAVEAFRTENDRIAEAELAGSRVRSVFLPIVDLAELGGVLAVVGLGTWALSTDRLTLGGLLAFLTLMAQTYRPVRDLSDLIPSLFSATAGVERVSELLDEPVLEERDGAITLDAPTGRVELDEVSVRYQGAGRDAVSDVSITAQPGEIVAVVGASGAGKTTLLRLLTRGVEPSTGRVLLDGHELRDLTLSSLRNAVTVVLQETLLIDASVADNIAFARPSARRDEIEAAARAADAHEFIEALPQGYDTRVGQRGRALSGGQRQRIAIARALLRDSPVLLLDEPTTGLDPASAARVLAPLRAASQGRTVIVVTHDPVALDVADRVIHLADGRLVAPESAA
jgi:ATP-binding cassette subfamily B protein